MDLKNIFFGMREFLNFGSDPGESSKNDIRWFAIELDRSFSGLEVRVVVIDMGDCELIGVQQQHSHCSGKIIHSKQSPFVVYWQE
jgi:hypothetical protein